MSAGFAAPYRELLPEFERNTGVRVTTTSGPSLGKSPKTIAAQVRRVVTADLVILSREVDDGTDRPAHPRWSSPGRGNRK
jgi:molybdate transport system substrate-binding protein